MLRTALKPRWLALLGVVALVIVAFGQLGRWQLGVAEDTATREAIAQANKQGIVEISTLLKPHTPFPNALSARQVTATGTYAASGQVFVAHRRLDGAAGYWVVTPFRVASSGATLPVLRGFVTAPEQATAPPAGELTVRGGLAPGESPYSGVQPVPEGQLGSVDISILVNQWSGELYNAFLFLAEESPAGATDATGGTEQQASASELNQLTHVPTPTGSHGFKWRNAAYALQWWVFAAFAAWMWWRMVRDDRQKQLDSLAAEGGPGGDEDASGSMEENDPRD